MLSSGTADIVLELSRSIQIHARLGSRLNGVHLEMTGESVTECLGGSMELDDLSPRYQVRSPVIRSRLRDDRTTRRPFVTLGLMQSSRSISLSSFPLSCRI